MHLNMGMKCTMKLWNKSDRSKTIILSAQILTGNKTKIIRKRKLGEYKPRYVSFFDCILVRISSRGLTTDALKTRAEAPAKRGIQNGCSILPILLECLSLTLVRICSYATKYSTVAGTAKTNVGPRPLHSELIPSARDIFTKASYKNDNLAETWKINKTYNKVW